jgi:hypothetical protein
MAEYLQAPPRRKALGLLADALTSGQEALNTVNLPYVGGLGGLLFGQAPQYLQDVSYGMPAFRGGNVATGGLGTFTPDTRMLDVATLPFVGAGAAKAGQVGAKTLGKEIARQVETGTGILGSNVLDPRQYATAYHGSPAIFDKFDINKVGTGQGAQSYGHGIYFAENPAVAKEYQKELSGYQPGVKSLLQQYGDVDKAINEATDKVKHYQNLIKQGGLGLGEERANSLLNISTKQLADLQSVKAGIPENTGAFYKVDIPDQDIPKMLDWDKPISQQDKSIKPAIEAVLNKVKSIGSLFEKPNPDIMTGRDLYNSYTAYRGMNQDFASEGLNELGIKGIKYLDEGSRAAGKGTSNFVVFDPSQVKIIERNNKGLLK